MSTSSQVNKCILFIFKGELRSCQIKNSDHNYSCSVICRNLDNRLLLTITICYEFYKSVKFKHVKFQESNYSSVNFLLFVHYSDIIWEANKPEYFPPGEGNSSMRSIARGQRIELFPALRRKCSGLLTYQTLNNRFITEFQLRHNFCFLIISSNLQTNDFLKKWKDRF